MITVFKLRRTYVRFCLRGYIAKRTPVTTVEREKISRLPDLFFSTWPGLFFSRWPDLVRTFHSGFERAAPRPWVSWAWPKLQVQAFAAGQFQCQSVSTTVGRKHFAETGGEWRAGGWLAEHSLVGDGFHLLNILSCQLLFISELFLHYTGPGDKTLHSKKKKKKIFKNLKRSAQLTNSKIIRF